MQKMSGELIEKLYIICLNNYIFISKEIYFSKKNYKYSIAYLD